jgi:hypothetical protein
VYQEKKAGQLWLYLLAYLSWFGVILLTTLDFLLLRAALSQWYIVFNLPPNGHKAVDRFYLFFGGALLLFLIFFVEGYFRDGVVKGDLKSRLKLILGGSTVFAILMMGSLVLVNVYVYLMAL